MSGPSHYALWLIPLLVGQIVGCGTGATEATGGRAGGAGAESHGSAPAPEARARAGTDPVEAGAIPVAEPSESEPVTAAMTFRPGTAAPGETVELLVAVRIAGAHYVHAAGPGESPFTPLRMEVRLPAGVAGGGDWEYPPPAERRGGRVYRERVLLKRTLTVPADAPPQTLVVGGELHYQACNEEVCWPLRKVRVSAPLVVRPPTR